MPQQVTYDEDLTIIIDELFPRYGSVEGDNLVIIYTLNEFESDSGDILELEDVTVTIDGVECVVDYVDYDVIECISGPRVGLYTDDPTFEIILAGYGKVETLGQSFRYVSLWSEESTWGG